MRNHSATHLMHRRCAECSAAMSLSRKVAGRCRTRRFDFTHNAPMSEAEIRKVETIVNYEILANAATDYRA